MNWETYKKLNTQQREEYKFRFNNRETVSHYTHSLINNIMWMQGPFILLLIMYFMVMTNKTYFPPDVLISLQSSISLWGGLDKALLIWVAVLVVYYSIWSFYNLWEENKFLKDNNIKRVYIWERWIKKK